MSERPADPAELEPDAAQGSVFGNLPDSRPGGRSPRRDAAGKSRKATPKRTSKPARPAARPPGPPRTTNPPEPDDAGRESGAGIEDVAWAGVATIAEAATVGVRLLNKTLDALRGSSERS